MDVLRTEYVHCTQAYGFSRQRAALRIFLMFLVSWQYWGRPPNTNLCLPLLCDLDQNACYLWMSPKTAAAVPSCVNSGDVALRVPPGTRSLAQTGPAWSAWAGGLWPHLAIIKTKLCGSRSPSTPAGPLCAWNPFTSTSGKKNKTRRHENKNQGARDSGNGTLETAFRITTLHKAAEVFFQRKPKIESRQKSEGPPRRFDSSLFGWELSIVEPSLRVLGRRPQDSFPLPVKLFRSWDIHLQPLPTPRADVSQSKPVSAPATLWVCLVHALCLD